MNADETKSKQNAKRKRKQRENEEYRKMEQQKDTNAHINARNDEDKKLAEHQVPSIAIQLFRTYDEVDAYNRLAIALNQNAEHTSIAEDRVEGDVSQDVKIHALKVVSNLHSTKTMGLPSNLTLKEGAIYMVTINVDVEDGLLNGGNGILRKIDCIFDKPIRLWIEFFDKNVGSTARSKMSIYSSQEKWTPIDMVTKDISPMKNQNVRVRRTQFPLVPAEAITITKSQGQSYDSVVVKLSKRMLRSEYYVALSRARTAIGLYIDGIFEQPQETPTVLLVENELTKQRISAEWTVKYPFLSTYEASGITIVYQNVQSLVAHYEDIISDPDYTCADLMLFVECWTSTFDYLKVSDFNILHSVCCPSSKASGIVAYSKVKANILFEYKKSMDKSYFESFCLQHKDVSIVLLYNSPQSTIKDLFQNLDAIIGKVSKGKLVILGDFIIDTRKESGIALINHMLKNRLVLQSNEVTTNGNTCIDLVFIREFSLVVNIQESYFSHHKSLWFELL